MNRLQKLTLLVTVFLLSSGCTALLRTPSQSDSSISASTPTSNPKQLATSDSTQPVENPINSQPEQTTGEIAPQYLEISQRVQARVPNQELRQNNTDLNQLYEAAAVADVELQSITQELAKATQGTVVIPPGGLKDRERAEEKIMVDYGGDASRITDLARIALEYETLDQIYNALETVVDRTETLRFKDRFIKPTPGGYRDLLLNLKMPNGHIAELQITLRSLNEARFSQGHKLYEEARGIQAKAMMDGRELTPEESQRIEMLTQESEQLYGEAFARAMKQQPVSP